MSAGAVRALGLTAVIAVVAGAFSLHHPQLSDRRPAEIMLQAAVPSWRFAFDSVLPGENIRAVLRRHGFTDSTATVALQVAALDMRHLPPSMPVVVGSVAGDALPSDLKLQISVDHILHLRRTGPSWVARRDSLPWKTDTIAVAGEIKSNLFASMDAAAGTLLSPASREKLTESLADIFDYHIDMSRDLQRGDQFRVLTQRLIAPNGVAKFGAVLAAEFSLSGTHFRAVRFASARVTGDFFDTTGKSMRAAFLRAPLEFRRISSTFGMREHPILGVTRMHEGTDFAAPAGTPIRAIGDGTIIRAGWSDGYGNVIEIRHNNGIVTRYGHMERFASGVHSGLHVHISDVIGYVGSTGLATGPHLHFEVIVNGVQRDPRTALRRTDGDPIPAAERDSFVATRNRLLDLLASSPTGPTAIVAHK